MKITPDFTRTHTPISACSQRTRSYAAVNAFETKKKTTFSSLSFSFATLRYVNKRTSCVTCTYLTVIPSV